MKVDAGDAACSMEHKISGPPKPIVERLYVRIIEARSGLRLGWTRKSFADDIRFSEGCSRLSCQVPNSGPIVAIVDDDKAVGNAIEVLMRSMGLAAQAFSSGEEFLRSPELSRTGCLVVDFDMPRMNGLDLHNKLSLLGKEIPTVLITAYPSDDIRARALQAGVICYLPKPFDESDLLNCIHTALDRAKGNRGAP
jgi:CheY-like chemotaxis protein